MLETMQGLSMQAISGGRAMSQVDAELARVSKVLVAHVANNQNVTKCAAEVTVKMKLQWKASGEKEGGGIYTIHSSVSGKVPAELPYLGALYEDDGDGKGMPLLVCPKESKAVEQGRLPLERQSSDKK